MDSPDLELVDAASMDISESSRSPTPASTNPAQTDIESDIEVHIKEPKSVFDMVTSELLKIGAIPLERFATEDYPEEENVVPVQTSLVRTSDSLLNARDGEDTSKGARKEHFQAVAKIYEACMKTFENSDAISFSYKEDSGPNARECILTVTRPDGRSRSYTSGPFFSNKSDAKAHVASIAVDLNVLTFIKYGDVDSKSRTNVIVDSLDAPARLKVEDGKGLSFADRNETDVDDANVKAISDCCVEWRAGLVKPVYIHFSEPTVVHRAVGKRSRAPQGPTEDELMTLKQGCALKIEISQHTTRVFSVHHIYRTRAEAKAAVAEVAMKQGVIDFIKYANGQTAPTVFVRELEGDADENLNREVINETNQAEKEVTIEATAVNVTLKKHQIPLDAMTLQAFTNSLPKPFPETPGLKPTGEGNPVGWLNAAVQSAHGSRMSITWTYLSNAKLSSHGCLVRFNLPKIEDGRSYLVEPQFAKRSDGKSAVALLAISQNVGGWIHEISMAVENLITPEMRTKATSLMAPLNQECTRARIVGQPTYSYLHEEGAVGCTLRVEFSSDLWREYTVPVQYRTKPDARLAAILQAHYAGVVEFIRFRGADPPPDYHPEQTYDWKMARKIEEAQAHGQEVSSQKIHPETSAGRSVVQTKEQDQWKGGTKGDGHRGEGTWRSSFEGRSFGPGSSRDQPRAPFARGASSRGRFADSGRGFRGRDNLQRQGQPTRRYSGSELHQGPAGSRSPGADIVGAPGEASEFNQPRVTSYGYTPKHRRSAPGSRSGNYDFANNSRENDGYRDPRFGPPIEQELYREDYYSHSAPPPLGPIDGFYGFGPPPDPLAYRLPPLDPYSSGSGFYPPVPPPLPHRHANRDWERGEEIDSNHYPSHPSSSGYYNDHGYGDNLPPRNQSWRATRGHHDRGNFRGSGLQGPSRGRFQPRPEADSTERSPSRKGTFSNQQRENNSSQGGGPDYGSSDSRSSHAGRGHIVQPADTTPNQVAPQGHAINRTSRFDTGESNAVHSAQNAGGNNFKGDSDRELAERKRPRDASPRSQATGSNQPANLHTRPIENSVDPKRPGNYETALGDYCARNQMKAPMYRLENYSASKYKASVTVNKERFSLPSDFSTSFEAIEALSKQVLHRLQATRRRRESEA